MRSLFSTLRDITLTVVAPCAADVPGDLPNVLADEGLYTELVSEIQRFRGHVYVQDKAIPSSALDAQGRHYSAYDHKAWHLVLRDRRQCMWGAIRLGLFFQSSRTTQLEDLEIYKFLSRLPPEIGQPLEGAVRDYLSNSQALYPLFSEPGGWAIAEDGRRSTLAPVLAASIWSLGRAVGGGAGLAAATTRHQSAGILKKMGGFELFYDGSPIAPFFDSYHECFMELVGFDSSSLNRRLEDTVAHIQEYISMLPIITRPMPAPPALEEPAVPSRSALASGAPL